MNLVINTKLLIILKLTEFFCHIYNYFIINKLQFLVDNTPSESGFLWKKMERKGAERRFLEGVGSSSAFRLNPSVLCRCFFGGVFLSSCTNQSDMDNSLITTVAAAYTSICLIVNAIVGSSSFFACLWHDYMICIPF